MKKDFMILAIDTSCDETSAAVTLNNCVLVSIIASQIEHHQKWGGVVPFLAQKIHRQVIDEVVNKALTKARVKPTQLDALAVTVGPGLAPALEVGINFAKKMAQKFGKPLLAVSHLEGHLLSSFCANAKGQGPFTNVKPIFPILGLLVSGGHTQLVLMKKIGAYQLLGETLDDAAGEAFDKVAKMLSLGYPGGPVISELAKKGQPRYLLPIAMKHSRDLNYSFSGLKTACFNKIKSLKLKVKSFNKQLICDFCASFEKAVMESIVLKLEKAIIFYQPKQVVLGGGVISNLTLRKRARTVAKKYRVQVFTPFNNKLFTDNAGMIGVCGWYQAQRNDFVKDIAALDRQPNLNF